MERLAARCLTGTKGTKTAHKGRGYFLKSIWDPGFRKAAAAEGKLVSGGWTAGCRVSYPGYSTLCKKGQAFRINRLTLRLSGLLGFCWDDWSV